MNPKYLSLLDHLKLDPEVSDKTVMTINDFSYYVDNKLDGGSGKISLHLDIINDAYYVHNWKDDLLKLSSICKKTLDLYLNKDRFPCDYEEGEEFRNYNHFKDERDNYLMNSSNLLSQILESSGYDSNSFDSFVRYYDKYHDLYCFGWLFDSLKSSLKPFENEDKSQVSKRIINLFDFYDSNDVKKVIRKSFTQKFLYICMSQVFLEDVNENLLNFKNDYPVKSFKILSKFEELNFDTAIPSSELISDKEWYLDKILENLDSLVEQEGKAYRALFNYHNYFKYNHISSEKTASRYFELVIKNNFSCNKVESYLSFYNKIDDIEFKKSFTWSYFKQLSQAYNLCENEIKITSKKSKRRRQNELPEHIKMKLDDLFFLNLNEAISCGENPRQKIGLALSWSNDIIHLIKNHPERFMEYFNLVGGVS